MTDRSGDDARPAHHGQPVGSVKERAFSSGPDASIADRQLQLSAGLEALRQEIDKRQEQQDQLFKSLRAMGDMLLARIGETSAVRRGNSIEAVVEELLENFSRVEAQWENQADLQQRDHALIAEQLASARMTIAGHKRTDADVSILKQRLVAARDSRTKLFAAAEHVAAAQAKAHEGVVSSLQAVISEREQALHDLQSEMTSRRDAEVARYGDDLRVLHGRLIEHQIQTADARHDADAARQLAEDRLDELKQSYVGAGVSTASDEAIARLFRRSIFRRLTRFRFRAVVRNANIARDNGDWMEAARGYAAAFDMRPERSDICLQLANALTELGAFCWAEHGYRLALSDAPENPAIFFHLGHMFELSARPIQARWSYERAIALAGVHSGAAGRLLLLQSGR